MSSAIRAETDRQTIEAAQTGAPVVQDIPLLVETLKGRPPYSGIIEVASAVMLLSVGVLLYYGRLTGLNSFFGFSDFNQGL